MRMVRVTWSARDIGHGVEEGVTVGYWRDCDTWGKRELCGLPETVWLFDDEILDEEEIDLDAELASL